MEYGKKKKSLDAVTIAGLGLLTALVIVLQMLGGFIRFGQFSVSLVLAPIVIGAALYGVWAGGWLGFVFGVVVLFRDSAIFLAINPLATVVIVLLKGFLAGLAAGAVYKALAPKNSFLATLAASVVCPVVNTGVFLIGCYLFFMEWVRTMAEQLNFASVAAFMFGGLVGANFLFELLTNIVLNPIIMRIIAIRKKHVAGKPKKGMRGSQ
jgi:uncharacterized membrane protein